MAANSGTMVLSLSPSLYGARKHGMEYLYITCNHTNIPSKKTLEYLGGEFVELAELPEDNDMRVRDGQTHVLVYKFTF